MSNPCETHQSLVCLYNLMLVWMVVVDWYWFTCYRSNRFYLLQVKQGLQYFGVNHLCKLIGLNCRTNLLNLSLHLMPCDNQNTAQLGDNNHYIHSMLEILNPGEYSPCAGLCVRQWRIVNWICAAQNFPLSLLSLSFSIWQLSFLLWLRCKGGPIPISGTSIWALSK